MTKAYALVRLLHLGAMSVRQIVQVGGPGWTDKVVRATLLELKLLDAVAYTGYDLYRLTMEPDDILRRLRHRQQRQLEHPPARVAPLRPEVSGLRRPHDRVHPPADLVVSEATRRAHDPRRRALGQARARRAGAAHARHARLESLGGVGP